MSYCNVLEFVNTLCVWQSDNKYTSFLEKIFLQKLFWGQIMGTKDLMATNNGVMRKSSNYNIRSMLKKGPWTVLEDKILVEYVKKHGEGNWNAVQKNSGLMRCGKSCRLRWANHLRPNLKKGAFSADEECLIVELHAKLGNKWARMAAQLPGRTDNEIKNYWNTRFKRRQRAGIPIYPRELLVCQEYSSPPVLPASSFLPLSASTAHQHQPPTPICFLDTSSPLSNSYSSTSTSENHEMKLFHGSNLSLSLATVNASSLRTSFFSSDHDQGYSDNSTLQHDNEFKSLDFGINLCHEMGILELPSIQSTSVLLETPGISNSCSTDDDNQMNPGCNNENFRGTKNMSGLLEDVLGESHAVNVNPTKGDQSFPIINYRSDEGKSDFNMVEVENLQDNSDYSFGHDSCSLENNYGGGTENNEPAAELMMMSGVEDEILYNLLVNFPLAVPIPEWNISEGITKQL